jgi:hypothetical protein
MNARRALTPQPEAPRPSLPLVELVERARQSVVLVRAGASTGTGWLALDTGVIVTASSVVGRHADVSIEPETGAALTARVLHCNVGSDVAVVLIHPPLNAQVLRRATRPARLGQPVWSLGHDADNALVLHQGVIASTERPHDRQPRLGLSFVARTPGAPLFDMEGRVIGLLGRADEEGLATPVGALEGDLTELDVPWAELARRRPSYSCPACGAPLAPPLDRCLGCGAPTPDARELVDARAERVVREGLTALGAAAIHAQTSPGTWRVIFARGGSELPVEITLRVDGAGERWMASAVVVGVVQAHHEAFYRLLLSLNDETTEPFCLGIQDQEVVLRGMGPLPSALDRELAELARHVDHYRAVLRRAFEIAT